MERMRKIYSEQAFPQKAALDKIEP